MHGFYLLVEIYNSINIGELVYNVYLKNSSGELTFLGFTKDTSYKYNIGNEEKYTFVVKSCYTIFKANMSNGTEVTVDNEVIKIDISLDGDDPSGDVSNRIQQLGFVGNQYFLPECIRRRHCFWNQSEDGGRDYQGHQEGSQAADYHEVKSECYGHYRDCQSC